jgi:hypothetical protein
MGLLYLVFGYFHQMVGSVFESSNGWFGFNRKGLMDGWVYNSMDRPTKTENCCLPF